MALSLRADQKEESLMKVSGVIFQEVINSFVTGLRVEWMPVSYLGRVSMVSVSHVIGPTE